MRRRAATGGFMLAETLATFTLSALVLLGLVSAASVLLRAVDRSVAHVQSVDDLGQAMAALAHDIAGMRRARWNGMEPQPFVFRGGPNSLYFAKRIRNLDGSTTTHVVALREIATGAGPRLTRAEARLTAHASSFDELVFGPAREIWTGAARLRFAYVPLKAEGRPTPPSPTWTTPAELPAAILIEAVDRDTRHALVSSRISIAADADIGCVDVDEAGSGAQGAGPTAPTTPLAGSDPNMPAQQPQAQPTAGPAAAASEENNGFCGRPDLNAERKQAAAAQATPPPSAPTSAATGPTL